MTNSPVCTHCKGSGICPRCEGSGRFTVENSRSWWKRVRCQDCGGYDEGYMVKSAVWHEAGMPTREGILCVKCLELRLNRLLTIEDFTEVDVNHHIFLGYMMGTY